MKLIWNRTVVFRMEREEFYQKVIQVLIEHEGIEPSGLCRPSLEDLRAGNFRGSFIDLTDVLPKIEQREVSSILSKVSKSGAKVMVVASTYYSNTITEDGLNEIRTVESKQWWEVEILKNFSVVDKIVPFERSDFSVVTFQISVAGKRAIARLGQQLGGREGAARLKNRARLSVRLLLGQTTSQRQLFEDLNGKSVAIVGNARSLTEKDYGAAIDQHDIVIRFNRVPIVSRRSHGFKTDWVATGISVSQQRLNMLGARRLLWLSSQRRKMDADTVAVGDLYVHPKSEIKALEIRESLPRATTGAVAIDLLARSGLTRASLFGFDFFRSQSSSSHQTASDVPHDFGREEAFVRRLMDADQRFELIG